MTRRRVGVFGGAFDPPHVTHVALARAALDQRDLDELRIFPTGHPWHKARVLSAAAHRIAMAELAFGPIPGVIVDPRETSREGPTYTLDTLQQLQAEQPGAELVLIMGSDQARALPGWHGWREIVSAAIVCVAERLESAPSGVAAEPTDPLPRPASRFDPGTLPGLPAEARFEFLELPPVATSATDIRARLARHQRISGLVPPAVERYIDQHHLYAPRLMTTEAAAKKDTHKLQRAIIDGLEDVKAQDIQVFDTEHLSPLFERVIIASGTSNRQTKALAASVRDAVREAGFPKPRMEGEDNGEWIIVDCGAAVAHIMQPAIRQYYHLEEIWGDKPVRLKLGSAKPAAAGADAAASEKKQPAAAKTLRRASAAKTAIREAEQLAKAEKAERARPAARKTSARKTAAASTAAVASPAPARKRASASAASAAPAAPARKRAAAPRSASTASATAADKTAVAAPAKRTAKAAGTAAPAKTPVKVIGKPAARKTTSAKGAAAKSTAAPRKTPARKAAPRSP